MTTPIYVVDDDEAVLESLQSALTARGYDVRAFPDGEGFLGAIDGSAFGCVLLDVRLPDLSGLEILQQLGERAPKLAVVMMTGHADVPIAVSAMKAGAADFLEKPVRADANEAPGARPPGRNPPPDPPPHTRLPSRTHTRPEPTRP